MIVLISFSLALLVIIAGMILLAKTWKEGLGKIFSFISYASIALGILIFACTLCFSIGKMMCHGGMGDCHGAATPACHHMQGKCGSMGMMNCGPGASCMHGAACKSMSGGHMKCKGGDGMKCRKKIIRIERDDDGEITKEIEVEDSSQREE